MGEKDEILKDMPRKEYERMCPQCKSKENWQRYWQNAHEFHYLHVEDKDGKYKRADEWVHGREIRVYKTAGVNGDVVANVLRGICEVSRNIGLLPFQTTYAGSHPAIDEMLKSATNGHGSLDGTQLGIHLISDEARNTKGIGGIHANVIITDLPLAIGKRHWGQSEFEYGYIALSLPGVRQQDLNFIRTLTMHEAGHLFGLNLHHDSKWAAVNGYPETEDCTMMWEAESPKMCGKCLDALIYLWKGIEQYSKKKFFKDPEKLNESGETDIEKLF